MAMPDIDTIIYYYFVISIVAGVSTIGYGLYGAHEPFAIFLNTSYVASAVLLNTAIAIFFLIQKILIFLVLGNLDDDEYRKLTEYGKDVAFLSALSMTKVFQQPQYIPFFLLHEIVEPIHRLMLQRLVHLIGAHSEPLLIHFRLLGAIAASTALCVYIIYFILFRFETKRDTSLHLFVAYIYFRLTIPSLLVIGMYIQDVRGRKMKQSQRSLIRTVVGYNYTSRSRAYG
jgi:hypothetical protein